MSWKASCCKLLLRKFYSLLQDILLGSGYRHCVTLQDTEYYVVETNPLAMYFEKSFRTWRWAACLKDCGKNLCRADRYSCTVKCPWAFEQTHPLLFERLGLFPEGQIDRFVKLATPLHLIPLLLLRGSLSLFPHMFAWLKNHTFLWVIRNWTMKYSNFCRRFYGIKIGLESTHSRPQVFTAVCCESKPCFQWSVFYLMSLFQ
jgi:hypothetical protein